MDKYEKQFFEDLRILEEQASDNEITDEQLKKVADHLSEFLLQHKMFYHLSSEHISYLKFLLYKYQCIYVRLPRIYDIDIGYDERAGFQFFIVHREEVHDRVLLTNIIFGD